MAGTVEDYKNELNNIDTSKNSDLAIVTKEIGELLNEDTTDDGLESLSGSLTSGLSEYLKQDNEIVNSLLNVLNNLKEPYASSQEIASLKSFLQPLVKKDWSINAPDENILKVRLNIDSDKQNILLSKISELQNKVTDLGLKSTLTKISQIIRNPDKQNFDQLSKFLDDNNVVGDTPDSSSKAYVPTIINRLNMFLLNINSQIDTQSSIIDENDNERAKENKAYDELMSYIPNNLKKLNRMSNKDLKRLDDFIQRPNNQNKVFDLYYRMKYQVATLKSEGMDSKDEEKFNNILSLIEAKYKDSTELHEYELHEVFKNIEEGKNTSGNLKEFLKNHFNKTDWNGENLGNDFDVSKVSGKYNFSSEEFINKFNGLNSERIKGNNEKVSGIDISGLFKDNNLLDSFTIETGEDDKVILKYNGNEITAETMFKMFEDGKLNENGEKLVGLIASTNPDFINDIERNKCILDNKDGLFDKVVQYVKDNKTDEVNEDDDNEPVTNEIVEGKLEDFNLIEQVEKQINNALKNHNIEGQFYEKVVGDDGKETIKYNMNVIKQYLDAVKDEPYKGGGEDFKAITMAFQIALKYKFDGKYDDIGKVDGLFYRVDKKPSKTRTQIKKFQENYGFEGRDIDGKPGPKSIKLLLGVLNGETPAGDSSTEETGGTDNAGIDNTQPEGDNKEDVVESSNPEPEIEPFKGEPSEHKVAFESEDVKLDENLRAKVENVIGEDFIKEIEGEGGGFTFDIGMAEQYINWKYDQIGKMENKDARENLKNDKNLSVLVVAIQSVLKREMGTSELLLGKPFSKHAEGTIDGKITNDEKALIVKFQNKFGLNPDGLPGKTTIGKLKEWYSASAVDE